MIGAIFGDVVGSVYEFNNIKTKDFQLFSDKCSFTDDSVMTVAVAGALLKYEKINSIDTGLEKEKIVNVDAPWLDNVNLFKTLLISEMHKLGKKYPFAGYGGHFGLWLLTEETEPYGSYGNGSAMRVSPVGWYANSLEEALDIAKASAEITHSHPEGIKGAQVTAGAVYLARRGATKEEIRAFVKKYYSIDRSLDEIRPNYYFNETCMETVPQAMVAFLESESFEDCIRNGISLGGDSDTLCAIAGAVAEAYYGMSDEERNTALSYLDETLSSTADEFCRKYVIK